MKDVSDNKYISKRLGLAEMGDPKKASIQLSCPRIKCNYETKHYHNPLKAKTVLYWHIIQIHSNLNSKELMELKYVR